MCSTVAARRVKDRDGASRVVEDQGPGGVGVGKSKGWKKGKAHQLHTEADVPGPPLDHPAGGERLLPKLQLPI